MMKAEDQITAVIVNYKTPDLTRMALWSLRCMYPGLEIIVVDNAPGKDQAEKLNREAKEAGKTKVITNESNLHHGPGMDQAIRQMSSGFALLFDSDCIAFRKGFLEKMVDQLTDGSYASGALTYVDKFGYKAEPESKGAIAYIHPSCALLHVDQYKKLPPFEKHGAPCLGNMKAAGEQNFTLKSFPVSAYVYHIGRGTVDATGGYHLGKSGILNKIRRKTGL